MSQHAVLAVIRFRLNLFIVGCLTSGQSPCLRSGQPKNDELSSISVVWEDLSKVRVFSVLCFIWPAVLQEIVWEVVSTHPYAGIASGAS